MALPTIACQWVAVTDVVWVQICSCSTVRKNGALICRLLYVKEKLLQTMQMYKSAAVQVCEKRCMDVADSCMSEEPEQRANIWQVEDKCRRTSLEAHFSAEMGSSVRGSVICRHVKCSEMSVTLQYCSANTNMQKNWVADSCMSKEPEQISTVWVEGKCLQTS